MENNQTYVQEATEQKSSLIGGIVGALIGALIGAVVWTIVGMLGYVAGLVGLLIAYLASKGYDLLKGRQGTIKMVVLCVCVVLAVAVGTLGTCVWTIHNGYQEQVNALSDFERQYYEITPEDEFIMEVLSESEVQNEMLTNFGIGLVFGVLGAYGIIFSSKKKNTAAAPTDLESARVAPVDEVSSIEAAAVPAAEPVEDNAKEDVQA